MHDLCVFGLYHRGVTAGVFFETNIVWWHVHRCIWRIQY